MKQAYDLHSGFRDAFSRTIGEPPGGCRNAGAVFLAGLRSPLGTLVAGATSDGICLLEYSDRRMLETELVSLKKLFAALILPRVNQHLRVSHGGRDEEAQASPRSCRRRTIRSNLHPLIRHGRGPG